MRNITIVSFAVFLFACHNAGKKESDDRKNENSASDTSVSVNEKINADTALVATDPAKLIVPGKSIGLTFINQTAGDVSKLLGPADDGDAAMGKAVGKWYSKSNKTHSTIIYFTTNFGDSAEAKRVSQVRITSPYFLTAKGLSVGSRFDMIIKTFPALKESGYFKVKQEMKKIIRVFDDVNNGIAFEIDPEDICTGITIHKPGEKAFETYLSFVDGYERAE